MEIVDTPEGKRMRFSASRPVSGLDVSADIQREDGRIETLRLAASFQNASEFLSTAPPEEPREFDARLRLQGANDSEVLPFQFVEPGHHITLNPTGSQKH